MKQILGAKMQTRYSYSTLGLFAASAFLFSAVWSDAYAQTTATEKDIYSFAGTAGAAPGGANPEAGYVTGFLQGKDGNLYGTSFVGGANNFGTVFQVTTAGVEKVIYSFNDAGDGAFPVALVQGTDGSFYGTTTQTSTTSVGTVFKLTASGTLTTLQSFAATDAGIPEGLVIGTDGNLYGTTAGSSRASMTAPSTKITLACRHFYTPPSTRSGLTDGAKTTPTADPDGSAPNVLIQGRRWQSLWHHYRHQRP